MSKQTGGCLCGQVKYSLDTDFALGGVHCHCLDCQKSTGSGKATIVPIPEKDLQLEGTLKYYSVVGTSGASVERGFCENCGSPVISAVVGPAEWKGIKFIKAGSLDDSSWIDVGVSIWKSTARHWSSSEAGLTTFEHNLEA
jgi:hypothetical protein